jgi:ATP-binding protein involved in chromosome partitioning
VASTPLSAARAALAGITNPRTGTDLLAAGMVDELVIGDDGRATFTFLLRREDPATLVRQIRQAFAAAKLPDPRIQIKDPAGPAGSTHGPPGDAGKAVPPPPAQLSLPNLGKVIAISSGKGGVGKSTVASNLAIALASAGHRVGLMDGDIYGPNIPRMFGVFERPLFDATDRKMKPLEAHGVKLMSLGFIVERDAPAIWRGPIIMKIVTQFLRDVDWGDLDYFLVDLPPGTGDAQLSLVQATNVSGAVIVTTPQEMSVGDALRGAKMFDKVNVPVLGLVENMSGFTCPHCGEHTDLFPTGGGDRLSAELGVPVLGRIPMQAQLADLADRGRPIVVSAPESPAALALQEIAGRVVEAARTRGGAELPILRG